VVFRAFISWRVQNTFPCCAFFGRIIIIILYIYISIDFVQSFDCSLRCTFMVLVFPHIIFVCHIISQTMEFSLPLRGLNASICSELCAQMGTLFT
jgi:hypothetical protein